MKKWFVTVFVMLLISPVGHLHAVSKELVGKCGHWLDDALDVGWSRKDLSKLDYVMWRESRCIPRVFNNLDPNGGSAGLMQINQFWCLPNRYYKQGWLQAQGILDSCSELFNPEINLQAGLAIFEYSKEHNNNGWQPWGK
jgi:hypothetical protein